MFDTMTLTKISAALCGALLVFLLGSWAAEEIYHMKAPKKQAYAIEVEGADDAAEEEPEVDFAALVASADPSAGKKLFRQCSACHALKDGRNGAGPHLAGIVGRAVGSVEAFGGYSGVLNAAADVWTPEALNGFIEAPKKYAPGTTMGYNGMKKIEDRASLIAYLASGG